MIVRVVEKKSRELFPMGMYLMELIEVKEDKKNVYDNHKNCYDKDKWEECISFKFQPVNDKDKKYGYYWPKVLPVVNKSGKGKPSNLELMASRMMGLRELPAEYKTDAGAQKLIPIVFGMLGQRFNIALGVSKSGKGNEFLDASPLEPFDASKVATVEKQEPKSDFDSYPDSALKLPEKKEITFYDFKTVPKANLADAINLVLSKGAVKNEATGLYESPVLIKALDKFRVEAPTDINLSFEDDEIPF